MSDVQLAPLSAQALRIIDGERRAMEYIQALRDGTKQPEDLAVIVAALYGPELCGFCANVAKALEVSHA